MALARYRRDPTFDRDAPRDTSAERRRDRLGPSRPMLALLAVLVALITVDARDRVEACSA
jgi:hypothetical protein